MAAGKSSRINRQYKTKYRIRNWREYERGLRSRGDVTIWLSEDAIAAWIPPKNGLRGGQRRYSNLAIRTALTLRVVFGLPLRQTEGFLDSLPDSTPQFPRLPTASTGGSLGSATVDSTAAGYRKWARDPNIESGLGCGGSCDLTP